VTALRHQMTDVGRQRPYAIQSLLKRECALCNHMRAST